MRTTLTLLLLSFAVDTLAQTTLANPASKNCAAKGGMLVVEQNPTGGQYGVCIFQDGLQCEEWAMLRGQCRVGGIKVTGYATPAARYCAITGGKYKVTSPPKAPVETGTCNLPGGGQCDAAAYYDGSCTRQVAAKTIKARFACSGGKWIDATFDNGTPSRVALALSDGRKLTLPQAMSASGARYANKGESIVFWNKGNTAFMEENGKTTYDGCSTRP
jgi:hypothetical protein